MKITLFNILWKKELIHWKRIKEMFTKFNSVLSKFTFGVLIAFLITIAHYCFAFMSALYEIFLWCVKREMFKVNIQRMAIQVGMV